jgi:hypothetical protein
MRFRALWKRAHSPAVVKSGEGASASEDESSREQGGNGARFGGRYSGRLRDEAKIARIRVKCSLRVVGLSQRETHQGLW